MDSLEDLKMPLLNSDFVIIFRSRKMLVLLKKDSIFECFFFLFIHIQMHSLNDYINTYKKEIKSIKSGTHKNNL